MKQKSNTALRTKDGAGAARHDTHNQLGLAENSILASGYGTGRIAADPDLCKSDWDGTKIFATHDSSSNHRCHPSTDNKRQKPRMQTGEIIPPYRTRPSINRSQTTVAFIDGVNLHKGVLRLGWKLDYRRFRHFLAEQYSVTTALLFLGYVNQNRNMYRDLRHWGYSLIFRPTCFGNHGHLKGNCDTDLAVQAVAGCCDNRYDEAVLVSGDGDFFALTSFLVSRGKLRAIVAPSQLSCSNLLRKSGASLILIETLRDELEYPQFFKEDVTYYSRQTNNLVCCSGPTSPGACPEKTKPLSWPLSPTIGEQ